MTRDTAELREVVAVPDFRRLLRVRLAGQFADGLFQAALFSAVFFNPERATSAPQAAAAFALLLLPYSVVGPFAGVFLDRWRRQRVLVVANLARAATGLLFAALLAGVGATSVLVQVLALVVVSLSRFVLSGLSAALPHVVREDHLVVANSFSGTVGGGAALVGGATAVLLRPLVGADDTGAALSASAACLVYVGAALLAARIAGALLGPDEAAEAHWRAAVAGVARGVLEGARHVAAHGPAARGLAAIGAHRFFYGLSFVATLLLYTPDGAIGRGVAGLGEVVVGAGVGGLLAAVATPRATRVLGTSRWVTTVFAAAAVVEVALGLPYAHVPYLIASTVVGFAAQASKICVDTLLQENVDDAFRGRVFSFYDTVFNLAFVAAGGAAAVLLPDDGKSYLALGVVAGGYALTALGYGAASARGASAGRRAAGATVPAPALNPGRPAADAG